jgi:hypothetical protein
MVVTARPNLLSALRSRLLGFPEITSLVSSAAGWTDGRTEARIASQVHGLWAMPTRAIRMRRTGGPLVENDASMGLWRARIDLVCYGAHPHEAENLLDVVLPALVPLQGEPAGFTVGPCRVALIEPEAEVFADVDPTSGWPFAWVPLVALWLGVPVT